jgi:pimeloyl-ACP methyl ester carboxylesterase
VADVSMAGLVDWVVRFMDELQLGPAVVGGNAVGGQLAVALALEHPERVSGLVLAAASGLSDGSAERELPLGPTAAYVWAKMQEIVYDPGHVTAAWVTRIHCILTTRELARRVLRTASTAGRQALGPRLGEIRVPTLLVWGKQDRITPRPVAERFHALIPDADLVLLPECGHAPMLEHPGAFATILRDWLAEPRPRRERLTAGARAG